ncbi:MAG: DNA mismatch repair protein MutS [Nanoarchaeota archaeon]|jgi:DNA mismatch repair protein MutS|nr:DNA mismatch repair protein MutS [Nanoarchaeota archaeon]
MAATLTPGMKQYMDIKNKRPDCIILFRMGDFYETFFDDAVTISRELGITLTSRGKGDTQAPLAGIPYHAIDPYIAKLVKKGYKVGMVEQVEDPKKAVGLVKRELVRIITPGTVVESLILDHSANNYIMAFTKEEDYYGVSFCDISTGEFLVAKFTEDQFFDEVKRINPAEIIYPTSIDEKITNRLKTEGFLLNSYEYRAFWPDWAKTILKEHFNVLNLEGFGIKSDLEISCAGAVISYLKDTQKKTLEHIHKISEYNLSDFMHLDSSTVRNLELVKNVMENESATLLSVLDRTLTPMGKRLIRRWLVAPLVDKGKIEKRLFAVKELKDNIILRMDLRNALKKVYDIERLIGRVSYGNCNPKDLISLKTSLASLPELSNSLQDVSSLMLKEVSELPDLRTPKNLIEASIKNEPATTIREGNIVREGYNSELDELRGIAKNVRTFLAELEEREKERTGIKSLKIKYNKVIGYYIDITKSNLHLVPEDYVRKQSQVNSERFVTEELKEKENKILGAQERIHELEFEIFNNIVGELKKFTRDIQKVAKKISKLDVLASFAEISDEHNYVLPEFNYEGMFEVHEGRHPVIEVFSDIDFISNECNLSENERTMLITGPNMAGKSTYLRQNALIVLMAQIGCFVPASSAKLPVFDRIFSRIGAYDNLVREQSTFMVEMNESANILNNATADSFVILDEIGRGTSTYDGLSLAWAITEYLNNTIKCKSLFATHYHNLNQMKEQFSGIENYHILIEEKDDEIIFLRKIVKGGTDKSYGIQVAKLAGVPESVISSAKNFMVGLEEGQRSEKEDMGQKAEERENQLDVKVENSPRLSKASTVPFKKEEGVVAGHWGQVSKEADKNDIDKLTQEIPGDAPEYEPIERDVGDSQSSVLSNQWEPETENKNNEEDSRVDKLEKELEDIKRLLKTRE